VTIVQSPKSASEVHATLDQAEDEGRYVLWDCRRFEGMPSLVVFDPAWWRSRKRLTGEAAGRGAAYFLEGLDGRPWVLRHNRRGGALARINHDRFLWVGSKHARALAETQLLAEMRAEGLPVPAPVAALAHRRGMFYRGDVITECIEDAEPLADRLMRSGLEAVAWYTLGQVIALFHRCGIHHADLNARNVLIDNENAFHLIDFDKARRRRQGDWCLPNLSRLKRSLDKFAGQTATFVFLERDWAELQAGYDASMRSDARAQ